MGWGGCSWRSQGDTGKKDQGSGTMLGLHCEIPSQNNNGWYSTCLACCVSAWVPWKIKKGEMVGFVCVKVPLVDWCPLERRGTDKTGNHSRGKLQLSKVKSNVN